MPTLSRGMMDLATRAGQKVRHRILGPRSGLLVGRRDLGCAGSLLIGGHSLALGAVGSGLRRLELGQGPRRRAVAPER